MTAVYTSTSEETRELQKLVKKFSFFIKQYIVQIIGNNYRRLKKKTR